MQEKHSVPSSNMPALVLSSICIIAAGGLTYWLTPQMVQPFIGKKTAAIATPPIRGYDEIVNPKTSEAFCNRALARGEIGDQEGALKDFNEAIKLNPKNARARAGRAQVYVDKEKLALAIADFNEAVKYDPKNAKYWLGRGRAISIYGKNSREEILANYRKGIELDPQNAELLCASAYIRGLLLDTKGAIEDLTKAEQCDKNDAYIPYARGMEHLVLKNPQAAMVDFNKALALDPKYSTVLCARGRLQNELGNRKAAEKDFDQAVRVAPDDPWPREVRGQYRDSIGDKKGAAEDKKEQAVLEQKQKAKEKRAKKKRYQLITNPTIYKFCNDTLVSAQKLFGPAKVPINRLYIMYRSGNSCQTVMVDEKRGVFCICMANDGTTDVYYYSLGHELIHLLNTKLADPYIEGICSYYGNTLKSPYPRSFKPYTRQYDRGVVKLKFYRETYVLIQELIEKLGIKPVANMLQYGTWNKDSKFWQHVDIDKWLASLPQDKRIIARDIINKYADKIEKTLPDDGAYAFARPSDRGAYKDKWLKGETADSHAHRPNPKLLLPHEPGYEERMQHGSEEPTQHDSGSEEPAARF